MKFDIKELPKKITPIIAKLQQYAGFALVLTVLFIFGFVVLKIRSYATVEPSQTQVDEKLLELKRTTIDQKAINKIESLESTNVSVKALFDKARDNPFQE